MKDPTTRKYFRFGAVEIAVMRCFDGRRTPDEIARALAEQGMRIPSRTVEGFARKLSSIGVLERTLVERTTLELERLRAERRRRRQPKLFRGELMRMRWSMGDPDALFDRVLPAIRWCFTPGVPRGLGALVRRVLRCSHVEVGRVLAHGRATVLVRQPHVRRGRRALVHRRWSSSSSTSWVTRSRASTSAAKCTRWDSCSCISSPRSTAT